MTILCVGSAVYIAVCAMAFGGLIISSPTVGKALLDFARDYGTLLAGIPVLVAVIVAKQQLDANRRQHLATVKRSFREELDALNSIKHFANRYTGYEVQMVNRYFSGPFVGHAFVGNTYLRPGYPQPTAKVWDDVKACKSEAITQAAFELLVTLNGGNPFDFMSDEGIQFPLDVESIWDTGRIVFAARRVLDCVREQHEHLNQYF